MAELYSRIFVKTGRSHTELLSVLSSTISGHIDGGTVVGEDYIVDVRPNDEYSPEALQNDPEAFLYFPYTAEVFADDEKISLEIYLARVAAVMRALADDGMRVVVACDWEEVLPGNGKLGF